MGFNTKGLSVYEKMLKLQASEFTRDGIMYSDEAVDRIQSQILAQASPEFSKLDPPLELDVEAAARSREKTRAALVEMEDERVLATALGASKDFLEGPTTYSTTRFQVWENEGAYSVPVQFAEEVAALQGVAENEE